MHIVQVVEVRMSQYHWRFVEESRVQMCWLAKQVNGLNGPQLISIFIEYSNLELFVSIAEIEKSFINLEKFEVIEVLL